MRLSGAAGVASRGGRGLVRSGFSGAGLAALGCAVMLTCSWAQPAQAARLALVIGNDSYQQVQTLKNARTDAETMGRALKAADFDDVVVAVDRNRIQMNALIRQFIAKLSGGDEAVFYFSGHGVQLGGVSYLLPVDIGDESAALVRDEAIALHRILEDLAERNPRFTLVLIDACRDNPFGGNMKNVGSKGLAPTAPAEGQMVIYAAGANQKALDRLSETDRDTNGLFTRVWLKEMAKSGQPVHELVRSVRREVVRLAKSVGHDQVPALYDQSVGEFYFRRNAAGSPGKGEKDDGQIRFPDGDLEAWRVADSISSVQAYRAYLETYRTGRYAPAAKMRLAALEKPAAPAVAPAAVAVPKPSPEPSYPPGKVFRDCDGCPEMVVIPGGSFMMGSALSEADREADEGPQHKVQVAKFALGKTEVTQSLWKALMGSNPSYFKDCGGDCPAEQVSWEDAQQFVKQLNVHVAGREDGPYRLPSEAEWEYACRAGGTELYCGSANVGTVAWYGDNSGSETHRVGTKAINRFGLHDMSGNVWEWVQDCYRDTGYREAPTDGSAHVWKQGCDERVVRGGSWFNEPRFVRSAFRLWLAPSTRNFYLGFRVARTLQAP